MMWKYYLLIAYGLQSLYYSNLGTKIILYDVNEKRHLYSFCKQASTAVLYSTRISIL